MFNSEFNDAELATVLAALRYYQANGQGDPANRSDEIHDVATNGGEVEASLDGAAIDALCERLNARLGPPRVLVVMEGGVIQSIKADQRVYVAHIEYDDEVDDPVPIPQTDSSGAVVGTEDAYAHMHDVQVAEAWFELAWKAVEESGH